ncbi:single-stranded-DNA-specific exonuclease RecJ [Fructilactobacillus lindneri]|uniref:single-stranded-DNA-specific exonuclease RecJ n=1 Tax=Fructilactobacillus lindneri TaxID=53444 RepID=UPI000CD49900|nr:single-stranded-DNA-specific exonuclease RecJ [Fructilactobacillus lindneri]POG98840.1 single-stranded-DNA-specific exonuclease RecJ [Fructilactobacillus lindneri]
MFSSKFNWKLKPNLAKTDQVDKLSSELGITPLVAQLLINRGYTNEDEIRHFLSPDTSDLLEPFLLHDMEKTITRIQKAIENGEQITIYGDYDADGLTSTSILYETLLEIGANVNYYIPNRFKDGYGPNVNAFKKIIANGTSLIVTVDNGVSGFEAIEKANELNCDVIVTDHHELPKQLPNAYAIVHAELSPDYPFKYLSGAGIAFKVATALNDEIPQEQLDLAAIGTVADLVSLTGENRALVQFGLNVIHLTERPGLKSLIKRAKIKLDNVSEEDIGFKIAPELNAIGRMGDANPGVELLTTTDEVAADKLAKITEKKNEQRKELVTQIMSQAEIQVQNTTNQNRKTLLIVGKDWNAGALGIVASRIKDKYNKPTIVLTEDSEGKFAKGSGRSIEGFDLFKSLSTEQELMTAFGGHEMAIGMTIPVANLAKIAAVFENAADKQKLAFDKKPTLLINYQISADDITSELYDDINVLSPFGRDNEKPEFSIKPNSLSDVKAIGQDKNHLKFSLLGNRQKIAAIDFGIGNQLQEINYLSNNLKVAGTLSKNEFRGRTSLQIMVDDLAIDGRIIEDRRTSKLVQPMFSEIGTYVFFNPANKEKLEKYLGNDSQAILASQVTENSHYEKVFVVDCPKKITDLKKMLENIDTELLILYLYKKNVIKKIGMPTRAQYAKLFKFIQLRPEVMLRKQLDKISHTLKINKNMLVFMFQVFDELGFVEIKNGVMKKVLNPLHQDLNSAQIYQKRQQELEIEKQLLDLSHDEFIKLIQNINDK